MTSPLRHLVSGARGPAGLRRSVDLGATAGILGELGGLLSAVNGFSACNAGIQVFRAGTPGLGPELSQWNHPEMWKNTYGGIADGLFCFGQDLFGVQFAVQDRTTVVAFDSETGRITPLGTTLEAWAAWLLDDVDVHGCRAYATAWQDQCGPLGHSQRLVPWRLFALGGTYDFDNVTAKDAARCMRIRGPLARQIHELPQGTTITLASG
ncbi:SMI1/KNR4 family protein [Allosaccharopolyspora coralli]|uniref:SMI1/KNR4 family protein n=1 Tax=Allosaccharopolyspora coralli TaxID=2665642 RepID=UPI001C9E7202|nr:SMI1/KNR4 family protein [Allosaccharopolyspora coralli]